MVQLFFTLSMTKNMIRVTYQKKTWYVSLEKEVIHAASVLFTNDNLYKLSANPTWSWMLIIFIYGFLRNETLSQHYYHKTRVLPFGRWVRVQKHVQESRVSPQIESEIETLTCNLIKLVTTIIWSMNTLPKSGVWYFTIWINSVY